MNYIALICARGGSKGLPGKNIRPLGGKPLISWAINTAKKVDRISKIIVSTDCDGIARIAKENGAEVPFIRPSDLAKDNSPEWLVWKHALEYLSKNKQMEIDGLVVIPPTAPLRNVDDINNCLDEFEKGKVDIVITVSEAQRNPYFNMIVNNKDGYSSLVIQPESRITRRQDAPVVFDMTTVAYVVRPQFLNESNSIFSGRVRSVCIPRERAIDIDTLLDFKVAESLIKL